MVMEIVAVVAVVLFGMLVVTAIPTLLKLRETLSEARSLMIVAQQEMLPLFLSLNATLSRVNGVTDDVNQYVKQLSVFVRAIEDIGRQVNRFQLFARGGGYSASANLRGAWAGLRAASDSIRRNINTGGRSNGAQ